MTTDRQLPAGLHIVATPIGAARDITLRALDVLKDADVIAAEDTRNTRRLMDMHTVGLNGRPLMPYHDHNGAVQRPKLLQMMADGKSVAYVSDAGTPLVADPGFVLVREAIAAGLGVWAVPGPSALLAALVISGLPSDRFLFAGFAPNADGARRKFLAELAPVPATLVLFEAPKRVSRTLRACVDILGADRQAAVCRELTKKFEEVRRGRLLELSDHYGENPPRGEIVLVIDRDREGPEAADVEGALAAALETMSVKDAARTVADTLGIPRREVYQMALDLNKKP